ncbi:MAG: ATP-binding protein [Chloroflexota bacterium]
MTRYSCGEDSSANLKSELIADWMETNWIAQYPEIEWVIVSVDETMVEKRILAQFTPDTLLQEKYHFAGRTRAKSSAVPYIYHHQRGEINNSTGTYIYRFESDTDAIDVAVASAFFADDMYQQVTLACIPTDKLKLWYAFREACMKFAYPDNEIMVIGGRTRTINAKVKIDDVILSASLKQSIMNDVHAFFERGAAVYRELGLNPFRKLLFAGVPGTGKTMLCNALAGWALQQGHRVIYISSAQRGMGETDGAQFWKIEQALSTAAYANRPALIILEEMDAYLKEGDKAIILNVLDGAEGAENSHGTLLIATTNYPEAIDERVIKRPGRLDRIYIVPPIEDEAQATAMLERYLKHFWREEHAALASEFVGYPGAFVREVVVFAITQMISNNQETLSYDALRTSYEMLQAQLKERDAFISKQTTSDTTTGATTLTTINGTT